mgnify:CR=1 FL=1|jgi:hypothetical protein
MIPAVVNRRKVRWISFLKECEKRTQIDNLDLGPVVIDFAGDSCQRRKFYASGTNIWVSRLLR